MPLPEYTQLVNEAKAQVNEIEPADLKKIQESGEDFTVIDVREPDEQAAGMIPGATPIPRGMLEHDIDKVTTDKNRTLVIYCGGGGRSALAALNLKKMGFQNALSLAGGYKGWRKSQS